MKKSLAILTVAASTILAACGQKETIREVLVTTPPTEAPAPEVNKFDQYLEFLYSESGQSRSWAEDDLLNLGTLVCDVFEQGGTIDGVIATFTKESTGAYDDELYSAIIAGSVLFLCPEWTDYVQDQLN